MKVPAMKAADWIDQVKIKNGWGSDYRVAKELGISATTISMYRSRSSTLDEEAAIKVANALGEKPASVYLDQLAERIKSDDLRKAIKEQIKPLQITLIVGKVAVWHDAISSFLCFERTTKSQGAMALA